MVFEQGRGEVTVRVLERLLMVTGTGTAGTGTVWLSVTVEQS